jgi:multiple sugar transport system substrate-binding protein
MLFIAGCMALSLVSCGGGGGGNKLRFFHWEDAANQKYFEPIFREFEKRNPGWKVISEQATGSYLGKLNALMAAATPPDIFYLQANTMIYYAAKGELEPLNPFLQSDPDIQINKYFPGVRNLMTFRDNVYSLPKGCHSLALYYNKDLFDSEGLAYPDDTWTYDTMVVAAKKLTKDLDGDKRIDQYGFRGFQWLDIFTLMLSYGGGIISQDGNRIIATSRETIGALNFIFNTKYNMKISPSAGELGMDGSGGSQVDPFLLGKIAMQINIFASVYNLNTQAPTLNYDVAPIPKGPKGRISWLESTCFYMSSKTKNKQKAWELLRLLGGPMGQRIYAQVGRDIPAYDDEQAMASFLDPAQKPAHRKVFIDQLANAFFQRYQIDSVLTPWAQEWDRINNDKKDPAKAMADAYPNIRTGINELKAQIGEPPIN